MAGGSSPLSTLLQRGHTGQCEMAVERDPPCGCLSSVSYRQYLLSLAWPLLQRWGFLGAVILL